MEGIHSYEQKSTSEISYGLDTKQNRAIFANRREPNAAWSTPNQPTESRWFEWLKIFRWRIFASSNNDNHESYRLSSSSSSLAILNCHFGPYPTNEWRTSKYTLINFLPKNLFEQFRRLANFYFLVSAILQILLPFSPVGPTTSLLPLIFVVSTTAIKQAYEDYLRHNLDKEVNNRLCHVLRDKKLIKIRSKDIRVGDFVYVRNNEEIPCDMILIAVGGQSDRCYVTTANLDGETNLKSRTCFQIREQVGTIDALNQTLLVIECERPNATLYEFNGYLRVPKNLRSYELIVNDPQTSERVGFRALRDSKQISSIQETIFRRIKNCNVSPMSSKKSLPIVNGSQSSNMASCYEIPLTINNLLLRASRLRNTSNIYGLAVYTGRDTKLAHNSHVKANKFSSTESKVNIFLIIAFLILMSFSLVATLRYERPKGWFYEGLTTSDSFEQMLISHFLLYNYLVPISLYVTLEFVKFFGTLSVVDDKKMKVKVWQTITNASMSDKPINKQISEPQVKGALEDLQSFSSSKRIEVTEGARCNSSDLNEELGQVEVLFSDKTGTLTENKMRFKACSIYGQLYRSISDKLYLQPSDMNSADIPNVAKKMAEVTSNRNALLGPIRMTKKSVNRPFDHRHIPPLDKLKLVNNMDKQDEVVGFFIYLCLCSTITLNETLPLSDCLPDKTLNDYDFQSASPDEESLISAAHLCGVTMCKSNDKECFIVIERSMDQSKEIKESNSIFKPIVETKNSNDKYIVRHFKRLVVFEFNSVRKRMSVIYQDCDNDCMIMVSKGSEELLDCLKLNQLDSKGELIINTTLFHFEAFAKSGLRTLVVAMRLVKKEEHEEILKDMKDAQLSIQNRDHLLQKVYERAEFDLSLVGTTAVEDTLQEGVPETIKNLKTAGIKVWLLTGDKVETAISVAYLCKLLDRGMTIFKMVRQQDVQACQKLLMSFSVQLESIRSKKSKRSSRSSSSSGDEARFALIADGRSLHYAMKYAKDELATLSKKCTCVLGCRLSPLQKAEVVEMIKGSNEQPITAAIGDGANDVSMIQEAHVGIGVCGKEGRQAVNSSDFSINRFHMLNRLLFVHGHLFYHRTANTIHYFFYKNMLFILPQFIYSFYSLSSAFSLYHPILLVSYNLFFTSLPILIYGLTEVPIPETMLENYPAFYNLNRRSTQLRLTVFFGWLALGALQAFIAFYILFYNWGSHTPFLETGKMAGNNGFSIMLYNVVILTATFRLYFLAKSHTFYLNISTIGSLVILPLFLYIYSIINLSSIVDDNTLHGQFYAYISSPMFWIGSLTTTAAALLPDLIFYIRSRIEYFKILSDVIHK